MEITKDQIELNLENEQYDVAEQLARKYMQMNEEDFDAKILLGRCLGRLGKYDETLIVFQNVLKDSPHDAQVLYYLGLTYEAMKESHKSLEYYQKILWDKNYGVLANYRMGLIYSDYSKDYYDVKSATRHFLSATQSNQPIEDAFLRLAALEKGMRSIYVLQNGIKAFPKSEELHTRLAGYYLNLLGDSKNCIEAIKKAEQEEVVSLRLRFLHGVANYLLGNYRDALYILIALKSEVESDKNEFLLFISAIYLEQDEIDSSLLLLDEIIRNDFGNRLNYLAHIITLCCYFKAKNLDGMGRVINEIFVEEFKLNDDNLYFVELGGGINFGKYILAALDNANYVGLDDNLIAKIDGLKASFLTMKGDEKKDWALIEKLASNALRIYPENFVFHEVLAECYAASNRPRNSIYHYVFAQLVSQTYIYADIKTQLNKIIAKDKEIALAIKDVKNLIELYRWGVNNLSNYLLSDIVEVFFKSKKYRYVIEICDLFQYSHLVKANVIFEIAYSYAELNNRVKSKQYYEAYLRDVGESSAVYNNLAMIYEKDGLTEKAKELVLLALKLEPEKELYTNNLNRIHEKISVHVEQKKSYERAKNIFEQEPSQTKRAIALIYSKRDDENLIFLTYEQLAKILNIDPYVVSDEVELFIDKKYFDRITGKFPEDGFALKLNSELILQVEQQLEKYYKEAQIEKLVADLSYETLENKYEYSDELLKALTKIGSADFSAMLQRDLKEAVVSLATQSYKSALILCGSIVETILMDKLLADEKAAVATFEKIQNRDGNSIKSSDKKVENWNLNILLDVAYELKIISTNLYHWGNGIRGFRNLVHPAVEKRQEMEVSRENAEIAWSVARRLIKEITK